MSTAQARKEQEHPGQSTAAISPRHRPRRPFRHYLESYALLALTIATAAFFSVYPKTSGTFLTAANLRVMVSGDSVVAIVAFGMLVPLVCYQFDLSVGATATVASVFFAVALVHGAALPLAIVIAVGAGILIGVVNALLVTRLQIDAVITTLGTSLLITGVVSLKTNGIAITGNIPTALTNFGTHSTFGIPRPAIAWIVVAIFCYFLFEYTPYGRYLYALGSNWSAAKLVGIRVRVVLGASFVIAGVLGALAGVLQVAVAGSANPGLGDAVLLQGFAVAFLSVAAIKPGRFNAGGTVVSFLFLAVLTSGLNLAGSPPYVQDFVNGGALLLGVAMAVRLGGRKLL